MFKDYTMNQLILPLNLEVKLQNNDIAFHIHHLVESIPHEGRSSEDKVIQVAASLGNLLADSLASKLFDNLYSRYLEIILCTNSSLVWPFVTLTTDSQLQLLSTTEDLGGKDRSYTGQTDRSHIFVEV